VLDGRPLDSLTAEELRPHVGERFRIAEAALDSELVEVTELGKTGAEGFRAPFSLVFRAPMEPVLPQRMHCLENDELGALELFLVPIGPDEQGMRYEAVFG
jgi:hypothetical protein